MIQNLIKACRSLEKDWDREGFPILANKTLEKMNVDVSLEEFEKEIGLFLKEEELLPQLNLYNNFGEPSLTIFNNNKFALDVYFWRKNDTVIHSHGFRGAFKILYGLSLHEEFTVETVEEFSNDVLKTKLTSKNVCVMKRGDVQKINPEIELTHRVVHLDNPTVSLCLRTVEDVKLSQWHHLPAGLSFKKTHISEKTIKQTLYFQYLLGSDTLKAQKFYREMINSLSASAKISLYEGLCFDQMGLYEETGDLAAEILYEILKNEKWFSLYEKHFDALQKNLQESFATSPDLKLIAHAINNDYSKEKTDKLLKSFTNKEINVLCDELKSCSYVFTDLFKGFQENKINEF